jgi:hypothetical protein
LAGAAAVVGVVVEVYFECFLDFVVAVLAVLVVSVLPAGLLAPDAANITGTARTVKRVEVNSFFI